mmetsp:Transcript_13298/g.22891  ORF Transcript_13298/g.22891 Transcript_13298/m.22891 type:complete len:224 (+) Transcript_13298:394-1065(+)
MRMCSAISSTGISWPQRGHTCTRAARDSCSPSSRRKLLRILLASMSAEGSGKPSDASSLASMSMSMSMSSSPCSSPPAPAASPAPAACVTLLSAVVRRASARSCDTVTSGGSSLTSSSSNSISPATANSCQSMAAFSSRSRSSAACASNRSCSRSDSYAQRSSAKRNCSRWFINDSSSGSTVSSGNAARVYPSTNRRNTECNECCGFKNANIGLRCSRSNKPI